MAKIEKWQEPPPAKQVKPLPVRRSAECPRALHTLLDRYALHQLIFHLPLLSPVTIGA